MSVRGAIYNLFTPDRVARNACNNCNGYGIDVNCGGQLEACRICAGSGARGKWAIDSKGHFWLP